MQTENHAPDRAWLKTIPRSRIVYPASLAGVLKKRFWGLYTPLHPFLRGVLVAASFDIIHKKDERKDFVLGTIASGISVKEFVDFLIGKGFGNHFVAWKNDGELVGLRFLENNKYQYHVRIFENGEVRGHYERTPESNPFLHMHDEGIEDRSEYFYAVFGDKIIPVSGK